MYAIVRSDIHMPIGKMTAQAGHAFVDTFRIAERSAPERCHKYHFYEGPGTKIVLSGSLHQIEDVKRQAEELGFPCKLIVDSGHICPPDFDGSPVITALGIGPISKKEGKFLSKLKLVK